MIKRDHSAQRVYFSAIAAIAFMIIFGYVLLLFNPPTELDKKCLSKSYFEIGQCIHDETK
jgi:hypothetical protein